MATSKKPAFLFKGKETKKEEKSTKKAPPAAYKAMKPAKKK
jgi:hypothetical protein